MKKLAAITKSANKYSYCSNLKSNRESSKGNKSKDSKGYINNSASSTVICSSMDPKNKSCTYMSNHIKKMLNASLNSSNPSISAHRNRGKVPVTKQIRDINFGMTGFPFKNHSTSRPGNFNNTQKINIGDHLDCIESKIDKSKSPNDN